MAPKAPLLFFKLHNAGILQPLICRINSTSDSASVLWDFSPLHIAAALVLCIISAFYPQAPILGSFVHPPMQWNQKSQLLKFYLMVWRGVINSQHLLYSIHGTILMLSSQDVWRERGSEVLMQEWEFASLGCFLNEKQCHHLPEHQYNGQVPLPCSGMGTRW